MTILPELAAKYTAAVAAVNRALDAGTSYANPVADGAAAKFRAVRDDIAAAWRNATTEGELTAAALAMAELAKLVDRTMVNADGSPRLDNEAGYQQAISDAQAIAGRLARGVAWLVVLVAVVAIYIFHKDGA